MLYAQDMHKFSITPVHHRHQSINFKLVLLKFNFKRQAILHFNSKRNSRTESNFHNEMFRGFYFLISIFFLGVVMIRCNIFKGKIRNDNFVNAGRDAQPRRDDGLVLDHGNTGTVGISLPDT